MDTIYIRLRGRNEKPRDAKRRRVFLEREAANRGKNVSVAQIVREYIDKEVANK